MHSQWQQFLETQSATIENGVLACFTEPKQELQGCDQQAIMTDLSFYGIIKISGDDAQTFLQGQFSNDVKLVTPELAQISSYNSPKGRAFATFILFQTGEDYFVQLPREILEPTLKRLSMFVMRSAVKLEDISDQLVCLGLSGDSVEAIIDLPSKEAYTCKTDHGKTIIRVPGQQSRFIVLTDVKSAITLWNDLNVSVKPVGSACWQRLNILAGIPEVLSNTRESFVPQMLNLQIVGGISFTKGCYPGQEVVARMHYLGKLKKRMYLASLQQDSAPQAGDKIILKDSEQSVGEVVNAIQNGQKGYDLLLVLQIANEEDKLFLQGKAEQALQLKSLPYKIEQLTKNN
ncbi:MAG: folate-binding protein [Gammaproteobacteria bacterium]|nr:folate-binding protein [Gammaproteobacteria bacterium]MDH5729045.1 folate-binding protein [Gammaproteobacteria bacterium]